MKVAVTGDQEVKFVGLDRRGVNGKWGMTVASGFLLGQRRRGHIENK